MEVAMEVEDDAFFADLNKQISLLIMDDDEDPVVHFPSVSPQAFSRAIHPASQSPFPYQQACRRESKGTGVFIPQSSHPRRKNRQGKFSSKLQRQYCDNSRGHNSQASYPNNPSHNSFNPKRC